MFYDEMENALWNESLSQSEHTQLSMKEWVNNYGFDNPGKEWIVTPFDTIEKNPHYFGPSTPMPEL